MSNTVLPSGWVHLLEVWVVLSDIVVYLVQGHPPCGAADDRLTNHYKIGVIWPNITLVG